MFEKEAEEYAKDIFCNVNCSIGHPRARSVNLLDVEQTYIDGAEYGYNKAKEEYATELKEVVETCNHWQEVAEKANEWHKLDWDKAEENPDVDKLVRVRTRSGAEYICETYSYFPAEDEIGYGSVITQFTELNGDWVDDNEIEYWCYIEPFKE